MVVARTEHRIIQGNSNCGLTPLNEDTVENVFRIMKNMRLTSLALLLSALTVACSKYTEEQPPAAPKNWNLPVVTLDAGGEDEYALVGSVVSDQRVDVASRLSSYIREIRVQEGDRVRRGQVLVRLDASDVEGGIRQGRAAFGAAEAAFLDAHTDLERFQRLFDRGSVSDNEMRKVRLKFETARAALNQARAGLDTTLAQRAYADITSPVDGVVVARLKRAGDLAAPGIPLLIVESGRRLLFETFVAESRVAGLAEGKLAAVSIDGLPTTLKGTVSRVVPSGDPVTRSYLVKIALPEKEGLMPGMFGRASFAIGTSHVPVVPRRALVERGGLNGVFVVDEEGRAHFRWLRTGREWTDQVEVSAGLDANERIVAVAEPALRDGDRITQVRKMQ
ncbi:efflux RND transporter periplasmic adaptor subunit [Ferribacterium limneticum]|uniref:efflux RND transporter periplasmic adaptor subunit n=1 Tax=Ferribacterium limneticum TaxID=76259 RepID=UPI001CF85036|nr:efflux RND transporter periplasmic adaptor subunit [Ferribacterium limneticum]